MFQENARIRYQQKAFYIAPSFFWVKLLYVHQCRHFRVENLCDLRTNKGIQGHILPIFIFRHFDIARQVILKKEFSLEIKTSVFFRFGYIFVFIIFRCCDHNKTFKFDVTMHTLQRTSSKTLASKLIFNPLQFYIKNILFRYKKKFFVIFFLKYNRAYMFEFTATKLKYATSGSIFAIQRHTYIHNVIYA